MQAREIDLLDMIGDILSHWRGLVAALLAGAILMGGLSFVKSYRAAQNARKRSIASTFCNQLSSAIIVSHYTQSKKFST